MTLYGFSKDFFEKQDEKTLAEWHLKLISISFYFTNDKSEDDFNDEANKFYQNFSSAFSNYPKFVLVDQCWTDTVKIINDYYDDKIGTSFFYKSDDLKIGEQYLKEIISEEHELLDDFIHSDHLDSFWDNEIKKQRAKKIWLDLTGSCPDFPFTPSKDIILNKWERYKYSHPDCKELFKGDVGDPLE
jgi:hypothetical protein